MKKSTEELLSLIQSAENIESYLKENEEELQHWTLHGYLRHLMDEKQMKISDVMNRSGQSDYVYKVFKNQRKVSRDILLAIAIGMECDLEETQSMLRIACLACLDPRNQKDAIIIYGILHHFSITEINEVLFDLEESLL